MAIVRILEKTPLIGKTVDEVQEEFDINISNLNGSDVLYTDIKVMAEGEYKSIKRFCLTSCTLKEEMK